MTSSIAFKQQYMNAGLASNSSTINSQNKKKLPTNTVGIKGKMFKTVQQQQRQDAAKEVVPKNKGSIFSSQPKKPPQSRTPPPGKVQNSSKPKSSSTLRQSSKTPGYMSERKKAKSSMRSERPYRQNTDREKLIALSMSVSRINSADEEENEDYPQIQEIEQMGNNNFLSSIIGQTLTATKNNDRQMQHRKNQSSTIGFSHNVPQFYSEAKQSKTGQNSILDEESFQMSRAQFEDTQPFPESATDEAAQNYQEDQEKIFEVANKQNQFVSQHLEQMANQVMTLDQQLVQTKSMLRKYKDLVVKMQLQQNQHLHMISQLKEQKDKYKEKQKQLQEHLISKGDISLKDDSRLESLRVAPASSSVTPVNVTQFLQDFGQFQNKMDVNNKSQDNPKSNLKLKDMTQAKELMKTMTPEQQQLVQNLLLSLKDEQSMRLQSEEQHEQMMSQMVQNQNHLEQQLKQLKNKSPNTPLQALEQTTSTAPTSTTPTTATMNTTTGNVTTNTIAFNSETEEPSNQAVSDHQQQVQQQQEPEQNDQTVEENGNTETVEEQNQQEQIHEQQENTSHDNTN